VPPLQTPPPVRRGTPPPHTPPLSAPSAPQSDPQENLTNPALPEWLRSGQANVPNFHSAKSRPNVKNDPYFRFLADRTIGRAFGTLCRLSVCLSSVCDVLYPGKTAGPICMKFSGKLWTDHGTTILHFGSIRRNRAMPRY